MTKDNLSGEWRRAALWAAQRVVDWLWTSNDARILAGSYAVVHAVGRIEPMAAMLPWLLFMLMCGFEVWLGRFRAIVRHAESAAFMAVAILFACIYAAPALYLPAWVLAP